MTTYKCLECGKVFQAPVKVDYVRHQKYGGCAWGVLFGLPPLSIAAAIGFALVVGMLTKQETQSDKDRELGSIIAAIIANAIFAPLFTLFVGWVVKLFI